MTDSIIDRPNNTRETSCKKRSSLDFVLAKYFDVIDFSRRQKDESAASDTNAGGPANSVNIVGGFTWRVVLNYPVDMWHV